MKLTASALFDEANFLNDLQSNKNKISTFKAVLRNGHDALTTQFEQDVPIEELIRARAIFIDKILIQAWKQTFPKEHTDDIALLAVGGYGRCELHPHSDVDILILLAEDNIATYQQQIEQYITFLWDIGLEIGSSVRTLKECVEEAKNDITIATNIVESRLIYGPDTLYEKLCELTGPDQIWPSRLFFERKWDEQIKRHLRFHDTAYNLEPNIKESPGGLRDIQMIGWVAKRHFGDRTLSELVKREFLSENELLDLLAGQAFLWKVRFALHIITGRREDRLLFEHQRTLAKMLGYANKSKDAEADPDKPQLGVEVFMKDYYRTVMELNRLNEMLLQHYQETILHSDESSTPVSINSRFQANKHFLEVTHDKVFKNQPFALLEVFLIMQQNPQLKGIRAATIRLIREHNTLIDDDFRNDIRCISLFMEIIKQPQGLTHALRRMNSYGILGAYIPAYGKITGQMQFDLFHCYTVDQHTLFVIRNMRRFFVEKFRSEFPLCSDIIRTLPKPELLYIAGLFHDIAKGRGGDHSELGEADAREFCLHHKLSSHDAELVAWLVRNHLLMSSTAQHKDLSDPEDIWEFANHVENNIKLDYLYLLTVADMRATNDKVWNSWKDSLLKTLRQQTKLAFKLGLENPLRKDEKIKLTINSTKELLKDSQWPTEKIDSLWNMLGEKYFLRHEAKDIASQTNILLKYENKESIIHITGKGQSGASEIFFKTPSKNQLFAAVTRTLDQLCLTTLEAKIFTSKNKLAINTFTVLELDGSTITDKQRLKEIKSRLYDCFEKSTLTNQHNDAKANRKIECFAQASEISFVDDINNHRTIIEITATDRPGLLAKIAHVLMQNNVNVNNAKISTLGAQVDDTFFARDNNSQSYINVETQEKVKQQLIDLLDC